ncbi:MAG: hypothetical protein EA428_15290 [Spirochaetaceae bacterium]|nr:MAG: hypothetical protein EA428_15290 [Spirochaetaceae bacterium]
MDKNQISNNETLDKVYTAENHNELMDAYKSWAGDYDSDLLGSFGYVAHIASARALDRALETQTNAVILDAGSGTGLVGEELKKLGYTTMDALDYRDAWELLSMYDTDYLKNEGTTCKMCSYRVL